MLSKVSFQKIFAGDEVMLDLKCFIARHGEPCAQALIENFERYEGVRSLAGSSLEDRWKLVIGQSKSAEPHGDG